MTRLRVTVACAQALVSTSSGRVRILTRLTLYSRHCRRTLTCIQATHTRTNRCEAPSTHAKPLKPTMESRLRSLGEPRRFRRAIFGTLLFLCTTKHRLKCLSPRLTFEPKRGRTVQAVQIDGERLFARDNDKFLPLDGDLICCFCRQVSCLCHSPPGWNNVRIRGHHVPRFPMPQ